MELLEALAADPHFSGLTARQQEGLAAAFAVQSFADGDALMRTGEPGDAVYLVLDGQVDVTAGGQALASLGPGTLVGLVALADYEPRSATAAAAGPVRAARLPRDAVNALTDEDPQIGVALRLAVAAQLAHDFRNVSDKVLSLLGGAVVAQAAQAQVHDYDVVVIGGGPVGLAYATWVKRARPETRIAVIERRAVPGYKIGEALLGGTVRAFLSLGLGRSLLRRLLANKWGMAFWWTGRDSAELSTHVDVGGIDETYQVERRVLELALQKTTERAGVDLFRDHLVRIKESSIEPDEGEANELVCEGPEGAEVRFRAPVVCDASGAASVIPRRLGLYRKSVESFQTNAYFAYFRPKGSPDLEHWDFGMSRHVCFPEGWFWFISVCSWEQASDEAMSAMADYLLDFQGTEDEFPTRKELSEKFDAPYEMVMSIGVVPRADLDLASGTGIEEKFKSYLAAYPGAQYILDHFELIEKPYADHATFAGFQKMAHDCERFTGDGWLAVGDAAVFTNPLYAPGMNYGTGTAFMAAQATVNALNRRDYSARSFAAYEEYVRDVFDELLVENEMFYRAFRHPDMMERCLMLKFFFGTTDRIATRSGATAADPYTASEPYIFDLLNPRFTTVVRQVLDVQRADEEAGVDPAKTAKSVRAVIDPFLASLAQMPAVKEAEYGRFFTHYTNDLKRSAKKNKSIARMVTWHCPTCSTWVSIKQNRCHVCGTAGERSLKRTLVRMRLPG
ncbi:MAG TPA: cyclic nucleotide-binding domain-containing protein [Acidimicrobiales bacterium]|jgi:flavin-dependent dehydrogenase|nr:cyclic nucleotide-binding domain-containing protein [Acidimicrobiales bacterium]